MAQFEAEIKNSISQLQATVAQLAQQTERANAGMRGLSTTTREVGTHMQSVGNHGGNAMKSIAYGSKEAGSHLGGILAHVSHLNPAFLLAGAGIGFLTGQVMELVSSFGEASRKAEELAVKTRAAREEAYKKDLAVALHANIQERRAATSARFRTSYDEPIDPEVLSAARIGQEHGMSESDARSAAELERHKGKYLASGAGIFAKAPAPTSDDLQRAASGFGDDKSGFAQAELYRKYGDESIQTRILEELQKSTEIQRRAAEQTSLDRITGRRGTGAQDQADAKARELENFRAQMVEGTR